MAFAGGVAALSWEMVWQHEATLAFGVSAAGTALTLAASMGGMTVGALAMGRWLRDRSPEHPLRLYGALELAIGIAGLRGERTQRLFDENHAALLAARSATAPEPKP